MDRTPQPMFPEVLVLAVNLENILEARQAALERIASSLVMKILQLLCGGSQPPGSCAQDEFGLHVALGVRIQGGKVSSGTVRQSQYSNNETKPRRSQQTRQQNDKLRTRTAALIP